MADEQINVPSLVVILVLSGLIIKYFFFSPSSPPTGSGSGSGSGSGPGGVRNGRNGRTAQAQQQQATQQRSREAAAEVILQMFPQVDRRTVLWDLQRNGGNMAATTERILAGRMDTPPVTFQPPPPPGQPPTGTGNARSGSTLQQLQQRVNAKPAQPDLITRYNLKDKLAQAKWEEERGLPSSTAEKSGGGGGNGNGNGKEKAWSTNKDERQTLLQKRRDQMILEARRKMEARIAAEKAAASSGSASGSS
ncbi:hypothetical protein QBC46DRAFT_376514 [Diplogelasinospora grovesii]|uniref:CUE domain-containing protein n=1 Tax=Diplogelasinospora grovesii TaxID=303347 RepID=A0AAN6S8G0_9PEZI|nr:hypothetical protein QBC46DRAFT_376514 [Diplogelasinospora grovesii]